MFYVRRASAAQRTSRQRVCTDPFVTRLLRTGVSQHDNLKAICFIVECIDDGLVPVLDGSCGLSGWVGPAC